ncbi:MAG: prephenate dehydrogenase [Frankiales bacterium]|nr:prephenate dehydrogenase [Frankiales bacterium]
MADILVMGCGLIGASVGLALGAAGWDVVLDDQDPSVVGEAVRRGAGRPWDEAEPAGVALVAVPPRVTAGTLIALQRLDIAQTYTHVASVQSQVQREVEALSPDSSVIVGSHPLAGRELSGPRGATGDLFVGRPWAVCPTDRTSGSAVEAVRRIITACGADAVELSAVAHDAAVGLLSHLPQVASSALAAGLASPGSPGRAGAAGRLEADPSRLRLAGSGLVDTTRLAASDPDLWVQILELNASEVAPLVTALGERLLAAGTALATLGGTASPPEAAAAVAVLRDLLRDGNAGRALVPVKRGVRSEAFAPLRVTVSDEPGRLAALLTDAGAVGVNVEDVHVEHVPGRPSGVIELLVRRDDLEPLAKELLALGWKVQQPD